MDKREAVKVKRVWQLADEGLVLFRQFLVCPFGGDAREGIEVFRLRNINSRFIVIAKQNMRGYLVDNFHAFVWICPVTDNITEANNLIGIVGFDKFERFLQCFKIAVDVRDDSDSHKVCNLENKRRVATIRCPLQKLSYVFCCFFFAAGKRMLLRISRYPGEFL